MVKEELQGEGNDTQEKFGFPKWIASSENGKCTIKYKMLFLIFLALQEWIENNHNTFYGR